MDNRDKNTRWRIFAENLTTGQSATDAYLAAGFNTTRESAQRCASRLRRQPKVAAYLAELRDYALEEAREDTILHLRATLAYLARIVTTSAATLQDDDPLIQSSRTCKDGTRSIRMPDKLRALKMHAELCGFFDRPARKPIEVLNPIAKLVAEIRAGGGDIDPPKRKRSTKLNIAPSPEADPNPSDLDEPFPYFSPHPDNPHHAAPPSDEDTTSENHNANSTKLNISEIAPLSPKPKRPAQPIITPFTPWPDDPICQRLLSGSYAKPKVRVIRD